MDLASENGGNCELTQKDEVIDYNGVTIDGTSNIPGTMPVHASELYAKNITALLTYMIKDGQLDLDQFVSAFKSLGYIEGGGPNIPDDAIVLSKTRNRRGDQLIGDVFGKGDTDKDGLISIEEFLEVAREIEPEG